jgi:EAL domain-containing protein (putative c-di-GMP-specific phosphodiesterase class I)
VASATRVLELCRLSASPSRWTTSEPGYSSLSHLKRFAVDVVTVDKAFVDGACTRNEESTLVRSILAIGAEFGLQVVANGIESEAQDRELRRLGCDYGQGYLYMCPVPAERIDELLMSHRPARVAR